MNAAADSPRTPLAFGLSALLHGLVAALVLWSFWRAGSEWVSTPIEHVFDLVNSPDSAPAPSPAPPRATVSQLQAPPLGELSPIQPAVSDPVPSAPARNVVPTPVTPPPAAPARSVAARNAAPPTPNRQTMNYQDFMRQSGPPRSSRAPAAARGNPRGVPNVSLNASQFADGLRSSVGRGGTGTDTAAGQGTTNNYEAMLKARLRAAFESPGGLALAGLAADIEITVAADGRIVGQQLMRSSGNPAFDAAVLAAMGRVTNVDPPPDARQHTFPFTFQLVSG